MTIQTQTQAQTAEVIRESIISTLDGFGAQMRPDMLDAIVDALTETVETPVVREEALEERAFVHAEELEERYEAGKMAMRAKAKRVRDVVAILRDTRVLIENAVAWTGPEDQRDKLLARVDDLLAYLKA